MRRFFRACMLLFFASHAVGQGSTPRIAVPVIALDSHRQPASLSIESLMIADQKLPVTDAALVQGSNLQLEMGVLIDTSNSRRGAYLDDTLRAMNKFVIETIRGPEDRAFLLTFSDTPRMTEWMKRDQLQNTSVRVAVGGRTALYDSLAVACDQRLGQRNGAKPTRRVLVVVSDGGDNQSRMTLGDAISEAQKSGAIIFSIDTYVGPTSRDEKDMEYLAVMTGGEFFGNITREEIPKVFARIEELIAKLYYVTYVPRKASETGLHEVAVKTMQKDKLKLDYSRKNLWNPTSNQ